MRIPLPPIASLLLVVGLSGDPSPSAAAIPAADVPGPARWYGLRTPLERPVRILFLGNSYTHRGPVPELVRDLATAGGWPAPEVAQVAPGGKSLAFHRRNRDSLAAIDAGGWDVVVLQDYSIRPTAAGDPRGFEADVRWFADRVARTSPGARLVLFETWARSPGHALYRRSFHDPDDMQAQLRRHYQRAAEQVGATVAPVGDAWARLLARSPDVRLHDDDLHHAGPVGQLLSAMVLFSTIYERPVPALDLPEDVEGLREVVDGA